MRQVGSGRLLVVGAVVLVLVELVVQARYYAWRDDFFGNLLGSPSEGPPFGVDLIRPVWVAGVLVLAAVLLRSVGAGESLRTWLAGAAFVAFVTSLWLTLARFSVPGRTTYALVFDPSAPDRAFQIALGLLGVTAVAVVALLVLPGRRD